MVLAIKKLPANARGPLEEGVTTHSSILAGKNPMERDAWRATVHSVAESDGTKTI